ncbi:hypothetical protein I79_026033 [Cricetulus griseus]|uniref:Uncharacterized protein n=1 Tax=Cricetulus griseus TaxID=10029 RepID=G3IPV1_CRIGR|nr:hypothetical protein I79_026033 [Cricetulus griseus]
MLKVPEVTSLRTSLLPSLHQDKALPLGRDNYTLYHNFLVILLHPAKQRRSQTQLFRDICLHCVKMCLCFPSLA